MMRRACAFWLQGIGRVILAVVLLGLSACGDTIPNTGGPQTDPPDTTREAPQQVEGSTVLQAETPQGEAVQQFAPFAEAQLAPATGDIFCPILRYPLLNDLTTLPTIDLDEPPPREPFYDPAFGSCLARLTDRTADHSPFDTSNSLFTPGAAVQAFNADSSRVLIRSDSGYWYVYNAITLLPVLHLPLEGAREVYWDPVDPSLLYFLRGTSLLRYDLADGQEQHVHNFADDFSNVVMDRISMLESSNISADGQIWGIAGLNASGSAVVLFLYHKGEDRVTAHLDLPMPSSVQGIRVSPNGNYLLAAFNTTCPEIESNGEVMLCGLVSFDRELANAQTVAAASGSFDTAYDSMRREVVVFHDQTMHSISMVDLRTGEQSALLLVDSSPSALQMKISGRNLNKPGWALASVYSLPNPSQSSWLDSTIIAFELKRDGMIARLAQNHAVYRGAEEANWVHPSASPNPDFTRVVFNSNWGGSSGDVEAYIIALPVDWENHGQ